MVLADLGARVIKVEHPGKGDDTRHWGPPFLGKESAYFLSINRNKESVHGRLQARARAATCSSGCSRAPTCSSRTSGPARSTAPGFGWEAVHARYPRLVYASISGYGQTGPRRDEPGYDAVMQAEGGLMSVTGDGDGPAIGSASRSPTSSPGLFAAQGIMAALLARERTGARAARRHRHARHHGGAAHLPGRQLLRDRQDSAAAGQPPSDHRAVRNLHDRRTARSSSPSATTGSGSGSARRSGGPSWPTIRGSRPTRPDGELRRDASPRSTRSLATRTRAEWIAALQRRRRALRRGARRRRGAGRPAAGRARHGRDADASRPSAPRA